jgi:DNA-binding CsgD family transcriptional regulator
MRMQQLNEIVCASGEEAFVSSLLAFADVAGFELVNAAVAGDRGDDEAPLFRMVGNIPEGWRDSSLDTDLGQRDPVLKLMKTSSRPVVYDQQVYVGAGAGDLWEQMAPFGYRTGIAVVTRMRSGNYFLLGLDRAEPLPRPEERMARLMADVCLFAAYAQASAEACILGDAAADAKITDGPKQPGAATRGPQAAILDPYDLEIIRWVASGKSSWAIGQLLNSNEAAINRRMKRVCDRLGVATRQQAVAYALARRWVQV